MRRDAPILKEIPKEDPMRSILLALPALMAMALPLRAADAPITPDLPMMSGNDHGGMAGHSHGGMSAPDGREVVPFPPEMRSQQLRNMRDHVQALDGILGQLAAANYDGAAQIATERLGLDSPSAAGCKPTDAGAPPPAKGSMDEMMALYMPAAMRSLGLAMHTAASTFAVTAHNAAETGDAKAAYAALAEVTHNCVACHSAYRLQ